MTTPKPPAHAIAEGLAKPKCRILIVDDHTIMRDGLRALLESDGRFEVLDAVENGREAVRAALALQPDLVLMDLAMPQMDALAAIQQLARRSPQTRVLALTMHKTEEHIRAALRAGARGYILKDSPRSELFMAIENVRNDKVFISPALAQPAVRSLSHSLTAREKQVLKLIAEGRRNRDIAECLFVSVKTVEKHRANLMGKLNLHNTAALTKFAIQNTVLTE
jgi:DNA-binding NarL/FixJ family response regulator